MIDLDRLRTVLLDHYRAILDRSAPYGDVVLPGQDESNLMYVTDLVWIKHILGHLDETDRQRDEWSTRINRDQEASTGLFRYPPGETHVDEHATWQCVAALNMLSREPTHPLACIEPLLDVDRFAAWCAAYEPPASHHRFMLAVIAAATYPPSKAWSAAFCDWYDAHQEPNSGFPFGADASRTLSPAFLLTTMRLALCGPPRRSDRIVRTILGFQTPLGGMTESDLPGYMEMDAASLLHRLGPESNADARQIDACLERIGAFVEATLSDRERLGRLLSNPHRALAACGTASVLQRHFGPPTQPAPPFPWAELEHYRVPTRSPGRST